MVLVLEATAGLAHIFGLAQNFSKVVILFDTKSVTQAIVANPPSKSTTIETHTKIFL